MTQTEPKQPDYGVWEAVLQRHVKPSSIRGVPVHSVDYEGIGNDPNFRHFLKSLETAPTSGLGKAGEYALWINSYNALAINMVVKNPCKKSLLGFKRTRISSLKDVGTVLKTVWKLPAGIVGGRTYALDDIEHNKLRAPEGYPVDPLLHSCIVCASVSCPDVALTAYKPESLQRDMEANMRRFLANDKKGFKLDKAERLVTLSKVFRWFEDDFIKVGNESVLDALLPYMPQDARAFVAENKASLRIDYFNYDWGLNGAPPAVPAKRGPC